MGIFDGVLGGIVGAGMVTVVNGIIEKHGGLQGVVNEFERNGLGATVKKNLTQMVQVFRFKTSSATARKRSFRSRKDRP